MIMPRAIFWRVLPFVVVFVMLLLYQSYTDQVNAVLNFSPPVPPTEWSRWVMVMTIGVVMVCGLRLIPLGLQLRRCKGVCCRRCLYDLRAVPARVCPECGLEFDPAKHKDYWRDWMW